MKGKRYTTEEEDTVAVGSEQRQNDPGSMPREQHKRTELPPLEA